MNILKYLLPCIALLFFSTTVVYSDDHDNKKYYDKDGKKYHKNKWDKKEMMWGKKRKQGDAFAMIEAQGRLFLYNKITGDVWMCNAFKKICEQIVVENKDTE